MCSVSISWQFLCGCTKRNVQHFNSTIVVQQVEGLSSEDGGTYFVDQSGQYYYQANSNEPPVMTQVQIQEVEEADVQNEEEATQEEQYQEIEELETTEAEENVSCAEIISTIFAPSNDVKVSTKNIQIACV